MLKWGVFILLGLIWGSSFLLIRVGVDELSPFQLVFIRTGIAAVGITAVMLLRGRRFPSNLRALTPLIVIGLGNTAIPFVLITWGEKSVESGLASVLQATASIFTLLVAHFALRDERINAQKFAGMLVSFAGVALLASRPNAEGEIVTSTLAGVFAIVLASFFYGVFTTYSKVAIRNRLEPIVVSAGAMVSAAVFSGIGMILAPLLGGQAPAPLETLSPEVAQSVLLLGVVNTFFAYLLFYWLVQQLGAARSAMVTYVVPPVGLALGVIFLGEQLDARLLVGAALIFAGILLVNVRLAQPVRRLATEEA